MVLREFIMNHWELAAEGLQTLLLLWLIFFKKYKQTVQIGGARMRKVSSYALKSKRIAKSKGIMK